MSIRAMKWAWQQPLSSTQRFVLVVLADAADECGACWPSVSTIAERCAISARTVQRALRDLIAADLIHCDPRYRGDGSNTSNRYVLHVRGGDTMTGAPVVNVTGGGHECRGTHGTDVTPRTTNRTVIDPPPPSAMVPDSNTSGGDLRKLIFPSKFTAAECIEATHRLSRFTTSLAQQVLDELNRRMERGEIKTTALAYLGGLILRARAGTFVPEVGPPNAERSMPRMQHRTSVDAHATKNSREPGPVYSDVSTNPLCRRVEEIQNKVEQRRTAETPPAQTSEVDNEPDQPRRPLFPELARVIGS